VDKNHWDDKLSEKVNDYSQIEQLGIYSDISLLRPCEDLDVSLQSINKNDAVNYYQINPTHQRRSLSKSIRKGMMTSMDFSDKRLRDEAAKKRIIDRQLLGITLKV
jgi:hypothetical protein